MFQQIQRRLYTSKTPDRLFKWRMNYPPPLEVEKRGGDIINDPLYNKGTNFSYQERDRMNLRGLVPPRRLSLNQQLRKICQGYRQEKDPLRRNLYLQALQNRNETLFFKILSDNIEELAPIVYTPTVGQVCQKFGDNYQRTRGMYFSLDDRGAMAPMTYNWSEDDVRVIVVTDGSRILGLGDLGCNGMGIPIGKLALYTAAGGIHPRQVLPVMLDAGTDNEALLEDPSYLGLQRKRVTGDEYYSLVDEMVCALRSRWPKALIQFEDFRSEVAANILDTYRHRSLCFNDDIQGTGAVTLAGVLSALRIKKKKSSDLIHEKIVVVGAGSAGIGVAKTLLSAMVANGLSESDARKRFWVCDQFGLMNRVRYDLTPGQEIFARNAGERNDKQSLLEVVRNVKPTVLLGLTACKGAFSQEIVEEMAKHTEHPILFPLSNPSSHAECSAEEAYKWTKGKCIFASGSPFDPVLLKESESKSKSESKSNEKEGIVSKMYYPSQCNNMFIFPGVGLGAILCGSKQVTDNMFYKASETLALCVHGEDERKGLVFPSICNIKDVSRKVATAVIKQSIDDGMATDSQVLLLREEELEDFVASRMYVSQYQPLVYKTDSTQTITWYE